MRILITGVGGPTPRSFAISLMKYGKIPNLKIFGTDVNPLSIGLYQNDLFCETFLIPPAKQTSGYWAAIENIIKDKQIEYAVILPELEVLEWSRRQAEGELPCLALIPDTGIAELLVDKEAMTQRLYDLGVVPKSIGFDREMVKADQLFESLGTPFWVRSSSGTSGLGSLKVFNETELRNWVQINPNVKQFLASKYLPGRNLACKLLYFEGELLRTACAERVSYIMAKVAPSGITGNTSFGRLINDEKLIDLSVSALDHLFEVTKSKLHGFFTVDFKEDVDGTPLITEINVRHVAFTQCFAAGGANFAEDTMRLLSNDFSFDKTYKQYVFEEGLIFLRDVDSLPIMMYENQLLK